MAVDYGDVLGAFPRTDREKQGILVEDGEIEDLRANGSKCLVGRLGVPKKINREAFKTLLTRIWRWGGGGHLL